MNPLASEPEPNEEPVQTMDERLLVYRQVILSVMDT